MKFLSRILWRLQARIHYSHVISAGKNIFLFNQREEFIAKAMQYVAASKLNGDYLEFGVYRGNTLAAAYHLATQSGLKEMNFYAFDSFGGLPKVGEIDFDEFGQFSGSEYSCSLDDFKESIFRKRVDLSRVKIIPGWYSEVLNQKTKNQLALTKATLIYIDCDLYKSTVPVLEFIKGYLQPGTILAFDDWFCFKGNPQKGEQLAFKEWLGKNPDIKVVEFNKFGWHGNSFIVY